MSYPYFLSYMIRQAGQTLFSSKVSDLKNEIRTERHLRAVEKKLANEYGCQTQEVVLLDVQNLPGTANITAGINIRYFCSFVAEDVLGSTVVEYQPLLSSQADMDQIESLIRKQTGIQQKLRVLTIHPMTVVFRDGGGSE